MTDLKTLLERARVQAQDGDAEQWKPLNDGDGIAGELVKIGKGGKFNATFYTLRTDDGDFFITAAPDTVLGRELHDHKLSVGDKIAIVYLGEKKSKAGRTYKAWSIIVEKTEKQTDGGHDDDLSF